MISDVYSYRQVMRYLSKCKKVRIGDSDQWESCQVLKYTEQIISALGV